jgi:hypothetical protein
MKNQMKKVIGERDSNTGDFLSLSDPEPVVSVYKRRIKEIWHANSIHCFYDALIVGTRDPFSHRKTGETFVQLHPKTV